MNHQANLVRLRAVANALADLNERVVFVGGATLSLYVTDPAVAEPRPTDDVDVVVEVASYVEFSRQIDEQLRRLGFANDVESTFIYRYKIRGLVVDVMSTDEKVLGFSNRWYKEGVRQSVTYALDEGQSIRIFPAPYFIAAKFDAFNSFRHGHDPRMNSDFEDIVYVFDSRPELFSEISQSPAEVRSFLRREMNRLLTDPTIEEIVYGHLDRRTAVQRMQRILAIWRRIANL